MTTVPDINFTLPGETWRPALVDGYFVSDLGRMASTRRPGPGGNRGGVRLLTLNPGSGGYLRTYLGGKYVLVQTVVAAAFLPPSPGAAFEIAFADGDTTNCRTSNLSWSTKRAKIDAKRAAGTWDPTVYNGRTTLTEDDVRALRVDLADGMRGIDAARKYRVTAANITHIKAGRAWGHVA